MLLITVPPAIVALVRAMFGDAPPPREHCRVARCSTSCRMQEVVEARWVTTGAMGFCVTDSAASYDAAGAVEEDGGGGARSGTPLAMRDLVVLIRDKEHRLALTYEQKDGVRPARVVESRNGIRGGSGGARNAVLGALLPPPRREVPGEMAGAGDVVLTPSEGQDGGGLLGATPENCPCS